MYDIDHIFDELVCNAPSFLKGVELTYEDAEYAKRLMKEGLSLSDAMSNVYNGIADTLGI